MRADLIGFADVLLSAGTLAAVLGALVGCGWLAAGGIVAVLAASVVGWAVTLREEALMRGPTSGRERVRQIEGAALAKLRAALGDAAVRDLVDASEEIGAARHAADAAHPPVETWAREYAPPVRAGEGAEEMATTEPGVIW